MTNRMMRRHDRLRATAPEAARRRPVDLPASATSASVVADGQLPRCHLDQPVAADLDEVEGLLALVLVRARADPIPYTVTMSTLHAGGLVALRRLQQRDPQCPRVTGIARRTRPRPPARGRSARSRCHRPRRPACSAARRPPACPASSAGGPPRAKTAIRATTTTRTTPAASAMRVMRDRRALSLMGVIMPLTACAGTRHAARVRSPRCTHGQASPRPTAHARGLRSTGGRGRPRTLIQGGRTWPRRR